MLQVTLLQISAGNDLFEIFMLRGELQPRVFITAKFLRKLITMSRTYSQNVGSASSSFYSASGTPSPGQKMGGQKASIIALIDKATTTIKRRLGADEYYHRHDVIPYISLCIRTALLLTRARYRSLDKQAGVLMPFRCRY